MLTGTNLGEDDGDMFDLTRKQHLRGVWKSMEICYQAIHYGHLFPFRSRAVRVESIVHWQGQWFISFQAMLFNGKWVSNGMVRQ